MMFKKYDRALLQIIDAKLTAIQSHLAGCTMIGLATNVRILETGIDKIMQSQVALSIELDLINKEVMKFAKRRAKPPEKSRKK